MQSLIFSNPICLATKEVSMENYNRRIQAISFGEIRVRKLSFFQNFSHFRSSGVFAFCLKERKDVSKNGLPQARSFRFRH